MTQIVFGARGFDIEDGGWVQLLVLVIVVVVSALSGIIKTKRAKTEGQEEPVSGGPHRAERKMPAAGGMGKQRITEIQPTVPPAPGAPLPQRQMVVRATPEWTKVVGQILEAVTGQPVPDFGVSREGRGVEVGPPPADRVKPLSGPIPPSAAKAGLKVAPLKIAVTKQEDKGIPGPALAQVKMPENLSEILADYADPDLLRRVILHYEILGRPLSVREPRDSAIGPF